MHSWVAAPCVSVEAREQALKLRVGTLNHQGFLTARMVASALTNSQCMLMLATDITPVRVYASQK